MTPAQISALRPIVLAEPSLAQAVLTGQDSVIAAWCNALADPAVIAWKTSITTQQIGEAMNSTEVGGLTTANTNRLMVMESYSGGTFNPSRADTRAGFDGVFSGAGGVLTRAALLVLYKRSATRAEKALATGTGSDASPATLTFEGLVSIDDAGLMR